ncbi:DUF2399 domain-containing protein [Micromonospora sp. WMMD710]|uniref:DUF2399 domain-containing protein n=1 Tax=Micromonospora sp. WMMD710 TaxID=3016085 RepID=UPI00241610EB|nr:DUF2399 domain-containing protein [Micromonospora sp. WMMD710]MDG4760324.1 DUF2399 domain-containing protein [Micromonospora sp. WMMD710]
MTATPNPPGLSDPIGHKPGPWCAPPCRQTDLTPLLHPSLTWLWKHLAAVADKRGDRHLTDGSTRITMPAEPGHRAAAVGLLRLRTPRPGQQIRVDLASLAQRLRARHNELTPGLVAAHAVQRVLAASAEATARREAALDQLHQTAVNEFAAIPATAAHRPDIDQLWPLLKRRGTVGRLEKIETRDAILRQAAAVIARLPHPDQRVDRRRLAEAATGSPHALDSGTLPGLILTTLAGAGALDPALKRRAAWAALGVNCDDLTGGLTTLGIYPAGWQLPSTETPTLTPRVLARCDWPRPTSPNSWVFVTENPSVVTAAADVADEQPERQPPLRVMCTVGTPSALEINALGRLAATGWNIAVRADFDEAGLNHTNALLAGIPGATPWRMSESDYHASLSDDTDAALDTLRLPDTPWRPALHAAMRERKAAAYEESLIEDLLQDLLAGQPQRDGWVLTID